MEENKSIEFYIEELKKANAEIKKYNEDKGSNFCRGFACGMGVASTIVGLTYTAIKLFKGK